MLFAVPKLRTWLQAGYFNALNFEHTFFLTEGYINYFLEKHGFEVTRKNSFMGEHSQFYECIKTGGNKNNEVPNHYEDNKRIFLDFVCKTREFVSEVMQKEASEKSNVYIFGGHIFSQFLLNTGLREECITAVLDNNRSKENKRLYGTHLFVKSPHILRNEIHPVVILRAGPYNQEIKDDILKNINPDVFFWE